MNAVAVIYINVNPDGSAVGGGMGLVSTPAGVPTGCALAC